MHVEWSPNGHFVAASTIDFRNHVSFGGISIMELMHSLYSRPTTISKMPTFLTNFH